MVPPVLRASLLVGFVGRSLWLTGCGTSATEPVNQKAAQALAQRLLGSVVLPASSRRLGRAPAPGLNRVPQKIDATTSVDRHSIWRVPLSEQALASFLQSHRPPGTSLVGTSSWVSRSESVDGLDWGYVHPPKGVSEAWLVDSLLALSPRSSAVRIDTQVVWLPVRTAASRVPLSDRSATISAQSLAPAVGKRSLTLSQGRQLSALIRLVNGLRTVAPPGTISCAMSTTSVRLTFRTEVGATANAATSQTIGCADMWLQVGPTRILLEQAHLVSMELALLHLTVAELNGPGS